ncbi:MAG: YadA-like family protein, partial [Collimonas sp.]|uniref:YadA family autotransporter adhesin n=1 Tax=Collimonas sp. TaxID=1963772 RepID=UPI0032668F56
TLVDFSNNNSAARTLTGVAAGDITSAASVDAVNGGQLFQTNQNVTNLDSRVTTVENNFDNGVIGLVKQDAVTHDITVAGDKAGSLVNLAGTDGNRTLTGVAAGALSAGSADAVNGSQLFQTNTNLTNLGNTVTGIDARVTTNEGDISNLYQQIGDGSVGLVLQDAATSSITVASTTGGTTVDFTGTDGARTLNGVANGLIGAGSMQAINGGQLFGIQSDWNQRFDDLVSSGDANWLDLKNKYDNLSGQVGVIDDRLGAVESGLADGSIGGGNGGAVTNPDNGNVQIGKDAQATGKGSVAVGNGAVASGDQSTAIGDNTNASGNNSVALGNGSVADRDNSVSIGSAGNERQLTNVADGTQATDAVNLRQLDGAVAGLRGDINSARADAAGGTAAAMAMASMPQPTGPGMSMMSVGAATYAGQTGMAVGVSHVTRDNRWVVKAAGNSSSRGNFGASVGAGYQW